MPLISQPTNEPFGGASDGAIPPSIGANKSIFADIGLTPGVSSIVIVILALWILHKVA